MTMRRNMGTERTNQIDAAASDWLIRRDSEAWSDADQARLDEWLNASTLNRVAFLRLELAWEDAARLKALGAGVPGDRPPAPGRWNLTPLFDPRESGSSHDDPQRAPPAPVSVHPGFEASRSTLTTPGSSPICEDTSAQSETGSLQVDEAHGSGIVDGPPKMLNLHATPAKSHFAKRRKHLRLGRRRLTFAAVATLLLGMGVGAYLALAPNGETYATAIGGLASVPLADGSQVTLNTDSRIRIALTDTERLVELGHGEAFFEVSKDAARPFVVRVGNKRVIAVGTKFSVRREGDDIEIVVTEGKVRVEDRAAGRGSSVDGSADVFLTPGNIARTDDAGVLVQRKTLREAEEQLSWRTGVLMFRDQSLGDAAAEFNRYNVRKIVIQDPIVATLKIEGNFRATNVEGFVRLLESGFPVRAETQANQIVLATK
jgi:transmembrane sensor